MSRSGGMGQLVKGIIMGIVLILAIIGSMNLLNKDKGRESTDSSQNTDYSVINTTEPTPNVKAPEINITSQNPIPKETVTKTVTNTDSPTTDSFTPSLESEETEKEKQADVINYGILKVSAINPENKNTLKADFVIFNNKNTKVAESNNTRSASYRLPTGTYNVVTTLVKSKDISTRDTAPVQSTNTITISTNKLTDEIVELEPPPTTGVLQVSATNAKNNQSMKANFIIQKENGETVASRQNITNSLFKLKAGSYKVSVKSGNNSDFRTVVVEPGESISEVFKLQESFTQGKVLVRIFDIRSNQAVRANIEISTQNGKVIQTLKAVSQTEIALAEGDYKIKITGSKGNASKNIHIVAGQSSNQIFRIDAPSTTTAVQINDNVKISDGNKAIHNDTRATIEPKNKNRRSILKIFARNSADQKPIKSNFYIQTPAGKHLAKKIYADSAEFNLEPGKYRMTVRAKNRKNMVRNIQIYANQSITEVFSLQRDIQGTTSTNKPSPILAPPKPVKTPVAIANGFLKVVMQPAKNTHFIITNNKGKKIVELTSVPSGNFKLDTGIYKVTAILNGQRRNQNIQVYRGKTSRLNFNANNFKKKTATNNTVQKGSLKSRIVDSNGRPLKGALTVTNLRGQIVAQANNVTFGVFDLPAVPHTITVNYQGLSGSERVNITAGKTTLQTFTISPDNAATKPPKTQKPRSAEDILREKLKEEFRRIF